MKIYLYLQTKILTFNIPKKTLGSYSFDEKQDEESKLINIEARNGEWYIYSTTDVSVSTSGSGSSISLKIEANNFYTLTRNEIKYLIYITETFDNSFLPYKYNENINLVVGNTTDSNLNYNCKFIKNSVLQIKMINKKIIATVLDNGVYLNNELIQPSQNNYTINGGDQIHIYGFKIVFLNGFIMINNPNNQVNINLKATNLTPYRLSVGDPNRYIDFKDTELYTKEQYFSKSPRLRRIITTKKIKLNEPPTQEGERELPTILTIGPMMTMGIISGVTLVQTITKLIAKTDTIQNAWPQLVTPGVMLISVILWPTLTDRFNKKLIERKKQKLTKRYTEYLNTKREELATETKLQRDILIENLIPIGQCLEIISIGRLRFWDKRIDQNDFLEVRLGMGNELLNVEVEYPEKGFSIEEDELRKKADELVAEYKYIQNVPIGYSFYKSKITAIMGEKSKQYGMINNIILQLITFYSYEDIKIAVFTNKLKEQNWEYIKYLNHSIANDKSIRFYSSDASSSKELSEFLNNEFTTRQAEAKENENLKQKNKENENKINQYKPYYIVITDDYSQIRKYKLAKNITEEDENYGFSLIILEDQMSKLPSKCNNFINLGSQTSGILKDSFDNQEQVTFIDEIQYGIDMMSITRKISNIPIEFEEGNKQLPDSITFLEMENVGKIEQLNILNRWEINDSSSSLKSEIGIDQDGNLMYLDLHEKYHGPHGLIAGTTGSGKSEFIITYILSMAINYSPDDVAFILIDYKGGGLAYAFENKMTGISLPHLAGTITNLDKSEMHRTLVSIDSETKRRQRVFNQARDELGESTMDIYKYQRYYKEGRLKTPVPHLFIICDEFAELKSQQPDFMDNLISVARIGRSLGVHLILATQKPSGVVNDQIWSNTKFRVCLKVQDEADSREMLKRPEAASIKQAGRFYLQVGYDEYFALGQSGWCGAKYYPSEKIVKQIDKSINFIDDVGNIIKRNQSENNIKIQAQGEQLSAIMKGIIEVANATKKYTKKLWLENIPGIILIENLIKKYNIQNVGYNVTAIIGEYDAPEKQEQGIVLYNLKQQGNTAIIGNDEVETEKLVMTILYSILTKHTTEEINVYIVDYGSEQMRVFNNFPQVGGMVFASEDEKKQNLFKLINEEIKSRKQLLVPYGGSFDSYNNANQEKLCQILFVINNYDSLKEEYDTIYEDISSIARESERYGIYILITFNSASSFNRKIAQSINNRYTLHLSDLYEYYDILDQRTTIPPKDIIGRGYINNNGLHEYQTASILESNDNIVEFINSVSENIKKIVTKKAKPIPALPDKLTLNLVENEITSLNSVPIGIYKNNLKVAKYNFKQNISTIISANKITYIKSFLDSLLDIFIRIKNLNIVFIDTINNMLELKEKKYNTKIINYYNDNLEEVIKKLIEIQRANKNTEIIYIINGAEKLNSKITSETLINFIKEVKSSDNSNIIIIDGQKQIKNIEYETWYEELKNNSDGIWIGNGIGEQFLFRIDSLNKETNQKINNNYGWYIKENNCQLVKLLEFYDMPNEGEDTDE